MVKRLLVVYDTKRGSTERVARYIVERLREKGISADAFRVSHAPPASGYDVVVVGSPVYYERPLGSVMKWLKEHRNVLKDVPVCLFVVAMAQRFGHPFKSYVYRRYLGMMRSALGKEPLCQGDITGYIFKEGKVTRYGAEAFADTIYRHVAG